MNEPLARELFAATLGELVVLFLIGTVTGFTVGVFTALVALSQ